MERHDLGVTVVRRCVDLADLLAVAATGTARAVLLSADLRRLDRDALARLGAAGVAVVGLVPPGEEDADRRLRQLGVRHVLAADVGAEQISAAVLDAVAAAGTAAAAPLGAAADPRAALPDFPVSPDVPSSPNFPSSSNLPSSPNCPDSPDPLNVVELAGQDPSDAPAEVPPPEDGPNARLVAVWGPTGAPGRTTVAIGIASELAELGRGALLVDADVYGGVVAQLLGLLDEAPGLAAAVRQANAGRLDLPGVAGLARGLGPNLRVLTGISRAGRWSELRPAALEVVLDLARRLAGVVVVDCGFGLEQDEELSYDTTAPRRNGATLAVVDRADTVLAVGSADPVGVQRLSRGLAELRELVPGADLRVVVNRVRRGVVPGNPQEEIRAALDRYAGVPDPVFVPLDVAALDAATAAGRTLAEAAPASAARRALAALAADLVGASPPARRRGLRRRAG